MRPATSGAGHRPQGRGYGLVLFSSILLVVIGCFNLIYGIAAIANSHVFAWAAVERGRCPGTARRTRVARVTAMTDLQGGGESRWAE
jgi:hypothetical protein